MPSSTVSPPNLRLRASISSSAIPSPAAAILLDLAIAAALAARLAEIEFLDVLVAAKPGAVAVEHDAAVLQHVAVIGDLKRHRRALLDEQHGNPKRAADLDQPADQVLDDDRRQTERQFIDQQELRPAHQGAGDRQHLALAARQQAAGPAPQLGQARKELIDEVLARPPLAPRQRRGERRDQVLGHRQVATDLVALGRQTPTRPSGSKMRKPIMTMPNAAKFTANRSLA